MSVEAYFCLDFFRSFCIKAKRTNKDSYPGLKERTLPLERKLQKA
jgi:hypothetical protein